MFGYGIMLYLPKLKSIHARCETFVPCAVIRQPVLKDNPLLLNQNAQPSPNAKKKDSAS